MSKKATKPGHIKFAVLATDVVCFRIINDELNVLLGAVNSAPYFINCWGVIGGLLKPEEEARQAAERLLREKAGIDSVYMEQLYTFSKVDRDPVGRVVSVAYLALAGDASQDISKASIETKWVSVKKIPTLAYDNKDAVEMALKRLQAKFEYTNIAQHLLPKEFTLSDLQKVYEIVLGKGIDKRNFRKKILLSGILKNTDKTRKEGVMRPAALYIFKSTKTEVVQVI